MAEWYLFLPQVRLSAADISDRALHAEASGFDGIAFIDHLEAPGRPDESIWEAMGIATWVAAKTERLRIGHLVLCDAFRHPAVLAKQAVTLSDASEGRFELGLGAGSWPSEFARFDVGQQDPRARVEQLGRHLALIRRYWGDDDEQSGKHQQQDTHALAHKSSPIRLDSCRRQQGCPWIRDQCTPWRQSGKGLGNGNGARVTRGKKVVHRENASEQVTSVECVGVLRLRKSSASPPTCCAQMTFLLRGEVRARPLLCLRMAVTSIS